MPEPPINRPPQKPPADESRGSLYWYKDGEWKVISLAEHLPVEFTPSELALLADQLWPLLAERMLTYWRDQAG